MNAAANPPAIGGALAPALAQADSANSAAAKNKLVKAAGEFESMMLESLWKSMKETFKDPDEDSDPILENFDDWGLHAMASAVGQQGGLGIKNMIVKYLEPRIPGAGDPVLGSETKEVSKDGSADRTIQVLRSRADSSWIAEGSRKKQSIAGTRKTI